MTPMMMMGQDGQCSGGCVDDGSCYKNDYMECMNCNPCGASSCEGYGLVSLYQGGDGEFCSNKHMNQWSQDWVLQDEDEEEDEAFEA